MERASKELSKLSKSGKKLFISTIKGEFKKSPLATNVVAGLILAGLEKIVEVEFACPCTPTWNALFAVAFYIIPGLTATVLMLFIQGFKCSNLPEWENFVFYGLGPFITWLVLVFLDGQYFVCAKTDWTGRFVIVDKAAPQRWCEPENGTLSVERMNKTQQWYFHSQFAGLGILLFCTIALGVYKCVRKCAKHEKGSQKTGSRVEQGQEEEMQNLEDTTAQASSQ